MKENNFYCKYCKKKVEGANTLFESHKACDFELLQLNPLKYDKFMEYWIDFTDLNQKEEELKELRNKLYKLLIKNDFELNRLIISFFIENFRKESVSWLFVGTDNYQDAIIINIINFFLLLFDCSFELLPNLIVKSFTTYRYKRGTLEEYLILFEFMYPQFRKFIEINYKNQPNKSIVQNKTDLIKQEKKKKFIDLFKYELKKIEEFGTYSEESREFWYKIDDFWYKIDYIVDEDEYFYVNFLLYLIEVDNIQLNNIFTSIKQITEFNITKIEKRIAEAIID